MAHGWWQTPARERPELRLKTIFEGVQELVEDFEPDAVALEESFVGADARTALSVGQARGAVLVAAALAGVECAEYAPSRVKQAVCGYGRAEKAQVQRMVQTILALARRRRRRSHAADALAVAICHALAPPLLRADGVVIARLRGTPVARRPDGLVLDVNGVGYLVAATPARSGGPSAARRSRSRRTSSSARTRSSSTGSPTRPSASCSSTCSRSAASGRRWRSRSSRARPSAELRRAIVLEDTARFEAIPGIGKKTAQRVVLELKEKIADAVELAAVVGARTATSSPATRSSSSATRSSTPSGRSPRSIRSSPPEERVREALRKAA